MFVKVAFFTVFALFLHQGEAIKCYQCTSATDPLCMDKVDATQMAECTPQIFKQAGTWLKDAASSVADLAGKIGVDLGDMSIPEADSVFACVKAVRTDGDKKIVLRSCSVPSKSKFDYCGQLKAQNAKGLDFCDTCDTDGCNGSSVLAPSAGLFLLVAALATLMARQ